MNRTPATFALAIALLSLQASHADAHPCGDFGTCNSITQCQEISQPGLYVIDGTNVSGVKLTFTGPECITVSGSDVELAMAFGGGVDGGGRGIGIHVTKSAANFVLTGDIGGGVQNLDIGIQVDADGATINPGNFDEPLSISAKVGILLNKVHGVTIGVGGDFGFSMSGYDTAVLIRGGGDNSMGPWMDPVLHYPGWGGLSGPGVGIDIEHSNNNLIIAPFIVGGSGVVIGPRSKNNLIDSGFFQNGEVGVEVKRGAKHNTITNNFAQDNQIDLRDDNPHCGSNTWSGDTFDIAVPSNCVQ